jgi:hypothetical protein
MPALIHSDQEFNDFYALWQLERHSPTWPLYKSPDAEILVRNAAFNLSGQISISHFVIAFDALVKDGTLKQLRAPKPVVKPLTLTAADYHAMPAREVTRKYMVDPDFHAAVDDLIATGQI